MVASLGINIELVYRLYSAGRRAGRVRRMIAAPVSSVFRAWATGADRVLRRRRHRRHRVGEGCAGRRAPDRLRRHLRQGGEVSIGGLRVLPDLAACRSSADGVVLLWRPEGIFGRRLK